MKSRKALISGSTTLLTGIDVVTSSALAVFSATAAMVGDATTAGTLDVIPGGATFVLDVVSIAGLSTAGAGTVASAADAAVSKPEAEYSKGANKVVLKDRFALGAGGDVAARSAVRDNCTDESDLGDAKLCTA